MKPDWIKLEDLYNQRSQLINSGRDVVYEIEKEINNLELMALQDSIVPDIAKRLATLLNRLKCTVEISLQYDGQGKIKYGFGKSDSLAFIQGEVIIDEKSRQESNTVSEPMPQYDKLSASPHQESIYHDVDKYIDIFRVMKTAVKGKRRHPAKAILLITILRGIDSGLITSTRRIYLNSTMMTAYNKTWTELVPSTWPFICNMCQPYIHLSSENFYNLDLKQPIPDMGASWQPSSVKRYVNFATIDYGLWRLAKDATQRNLLIKFLIDYFGLKGCDGQGHMVNTQSKAPSQVVPSTPRTKNVSPTMDDFKRFLSAYKSLSTGRNLSPSSVNVYANGLNSAFFQGILWDVAKTTNIFGIKDSSILLEIQRVVKHKTLTINNKAYLQTIKLYIEFWNQWKHIHN